MPVRFEISNGELKVVQSFDFPAVYLDHWAVRRFSSDEVLGQRFIRALKASGGALVVSHVNLAEVTGPNDRRHADEVAAFLEALLPNIYFALFDVEKAIDQEKLPRNAQIRLPPPPDVDLPDDFAPFTIARLIKLVAEYRERLGAVWNKTNQALADRIAQVRSDPKTVELAKRFTGHPSHVPTLAVMQELLRPFILDQALGVDSNDAGDYQHAILAITYCDYALLDGKWEDLHERMVRRFTKLGLSIRHAKVFSERRQGVKLFLKELEGAAAS
jgi:hypothetical protein